MRYPDLWRSAAMCVAAMLLAGCSDKEPGPGNPTGTSPAQAQGQALGVVQLVDDMMSDVGQIATGDLTAVGDAYYIVDGRLRRSEPVLEPRAASEPVWSDSAQAWVYFSSIADESGSFSLAYQVQFLDQSGTPQTNPDSTTNGVHYGVGIEAHGEGVDDQTGKPVEFDFDYAQVLEIDGLLTSVWVVGGGGAMNGAVSGAGPGESWQYSTQMGWGVDLSVPADGHECASGTVSVTVDAWSLVATYDASTSTYGWAMYEGSSGAPIATGAGTSACQVAAP